MVEKAEHERAVQAFLLRCKEEKPDEFEEVCEKYPTITYKRLKTIKTREVSLTQLEED